MCKPDAAMSTAETEPTERDVPCPVRRGHHIRERLPETAETCVVCRMAHNPEVEGSNPPPLPGESSPERRSPGGVFMLPETRLVTKSPRAGRRGTAGRSLAAGARRCWPCCAGSNRVLRCRVVDGVLTLNPEVTAFRWASKDELADMMD
jgi:hypothetical protein